MTETAKAIEELNAHIKKLEAQVNICLNNDRVTAAVLARLEAGQKRLLNYTKTLDDYCLEVDMSVRKKHLILTGIPEEASEQTSAADDSEGEPDLYATHRVALKVLASIHDVLIVDDIDCAYRIGRKGTKPRPILVKFCREFTRDSVYKKRFHLKDSDETKAVYINDDLPAKISQQLADMRCIVENAKANNVDARTVGNKVQVGEKTYGYRDLHSLPEGLKLENAKTKNTRRGIAFQGQHSIFSNFYSVQVNYNGRVFPSSEHAYQFDRVTYLGDHKLASQVFHAHTPQEAKRIGAQIGPSKKWDMVKVDRMKKIAMAKFSQNVRLRNELLKTAPVPLIEGTLDNFWGCGLSFTARNLVGGNWNGKNQMGTILVDCRNEIQHALNYNKQCQVPLGQPADPQIANQSLQAPSEPAQLPTHFPTYAPSQQYTQHQLPQPNLGFPPPPYPPMSQTFQQYNQNQSSQFFQQPPNPAQFPPATLYPTKLSQQMSTTQFSVGNTSPASSHESFTQGQRKYTYDPNLSPMLLA